MKNVPMRFDGFTFGHNPSKLRIEDADSVSAILPPVAPPDSRLMGRKPRVIRGEGELYGADCIEQYAGLYALYMQARKGILSLPHMTPMTAYLKELSLTASPKENILGIAFTFIEARGESAPVSVEPYYTVRENGESLWDIAYAFGSDMDTLVRLNPKIRFIDELNEGEKVRLC